jgi:hypothetical protein
MLSHETRWPAYEYHKKPPHPPSSPSSKTINSDKGNAKGTFDRDTDPLVHVALTRKNGRIVHICHYNAHLLLSS